MSEITLRLTLDEANLVLEGLGKLPFAEVYQLVAKIQAQASRQLEATPPTRPIPIEGPGLESEETTEKSHAA